MRPILLEMTAFGSYAEKTAVRFSDLKSGLYLVTGNTGAGKTTIFDAIMFALYGAASGSDRTPEMMHCDHADKSVDTEVRLCFSQNGKEYAATRTIHFPKKRGAGELYAPPVIDALLEEPDAAPTKGASRVTARCEELIGLDREQFRKIVMLAQGEFREFLKADSSKKNEILGKLFDNTAYLYCQNLLGGVRDELRRRRARTRDELQSLMRSSFRLPAGSGAADGELYMPENPRLRENLSALVAKEEAELAALDRMRAEARAAADALNERKGAAEELDRQFDELERRRRHEAELEERRAEIDARRERLARADAALHTAQPRIDRLADARQALDKARKNITDLREKRCDSAREIAEAQKLAEGDEELRTRAGELEAGIQRIADALPDYRTLQEERDSIAAAEGSLAEKERALRAAADRARAAEQEHHDLYQRFIAGQAGLLADRLAKTLAEDGEAACPVCGTRLCRDHIPALAPLRDGTPAQPEVDAARAAADAAEAERRVCEKAADALRSDIAVRKTKLLAGAKSLLPDAAGWEALTDDLLEAAEARQTELEDEKASVLAVLQAHRNALDEASNKQRITEALLKKELDALPALEHGEAEARAAADAALVSAGFADAAEVEAALLPLDGADGEAWLAAERDAVNAFDADVKHTKEERERLAERLAGRERVDTAELSERLLAAESCYAAENDRYSAMQTLLAGHRAVYARAGEHLDSLAASASAWARIDRLGDLALGASSDGGRLSFDRYVMGTVFREILEMANHRLDVMSGGRYELLHRTDADRRNAKAGLEIDVLDLRTGQRRPSGSLSGGETFVTSLALALGLSDVVQNHAGGKPLDALFIDEGFGSLSDDVLDKALDVLNALTEGDRLVGVISHVDRLGESIPQKIRVRSTERGSTLSVETA